MRSCQPIGGAVARIRQFLTILAVIGLLGLGFVSDQYFSSRAPRQTLEPLDEAGWVEQAAQRLAHQSVLARQSGPFSVRVLESSENTLAFVMPSRQIFLSRGLLENLNSEELAAAVLAHEMAHVIAGHLKGGLAGEQEGGFPGLFANWQVEPAHLPPQEAPNLPGQAELQADLLGMCLLAQAGYDPLAMLGLMDVLERAWTERSQPEDEFPFHENEQATHPSPQVRRANLLENLHTFEDCNP